MYVSHGHSVMYSKISIIGHFRERVFIILQTKQKACSLRSHICSVKTWKDFFLWSFLIFLCRRLLQPALLQSLPSLLFSSFCWVSTIYCGSDWRLFEKCRFYLFLSFLFSMVCFPLLQPETPLWYLITLYTRCLLTETNSTTHSLLPIVVGFCSTVAQNSFSNIANKWHASGYLNSLAELWKCLETCRY